MSSDPKLDTTLRMFLESWDQDQVSGNTIANLRLEVHQYRGEVLQYREEVRGVVHEQHLTKIRLDRHGRDIRQIKHRLEWEGEEEMDTGQHQIEDLKRALASKEAEIKERKEEGIWWRRSAVKWVVAGVAWIFTTLAAAAAANAFGRK